MTVKEPPQDTSRSVNEVVPSWREQKTINARHQAEELARRQRKESEAAHELLVDFVAQAKDRGLEPVQLWARSYNGSSRYKTKVRGWYLKRNESVAVDTEANFYVLSVQGSLAARFVGAPITPSDPPLVLGLGGRDGESLDLTEAIDRILNPSKYV